MPFGNCLELKDITWNWIFLHHISLRSDDLDVVQDRCGQEQSSDSGIVWQQRACECFNQESVTRTKYIFTSSSLRGKLHGIIIIVLIISLLVLLLLSTDCIYECRSAKHFKMKNPGKSFESDLLTLRQSLNTASRFSPPPKKKNYPNKKINSGNEEQRARRGIKCVTSWLSHGASSAPGSPMQWSTMRKRPAPFFISSSPSLSPVFLSLP